MPDYLNILRYKATRLQEFSNTCCRESANGQFCGCSGIETIPSGTDAKYWLSKDGKFVDVGPAHASVFPEDLDPGDYTGFANRTRSTRIDVNETSANVEIWVPTTEDQLSAIISELKRPTLYIQSHDKYGNTHPQIKRNPTRQEIEKAINLANDHVRGRKPSGSSEFLSIEKIEEFVSEANMSGTSLHDGREGVMSLKDRMESEVFEPIEGTIEEWRARMAIKEIALQKRIAEWEARKNVSSLKDRMESEVFVLYPSVEAAKLAHKRSEANVQAMLALEEISVAGLAVVANDTGRILMLQRAISEDDPASGKWEFPGGHIDPGENPITAAIREWTEETGLKLPEGDYDGSWISPNHIYQGFIYRIKEETALTINPDHEDRKVLNPDDPDGDNIEVIAWWNPLDLVDNPALREEVKNTDWKLFQINTSTISVEFSNPCHEPDSGRFCETEGKAENLPKYINPEAMTNDLGYGIKPILMETSSFDSTPYEDTPQQVTNLVESIKKNGMKEAIQVQKTGDKEFFVEDGRHRLEAARILGMEQVPVIIINDSTKPSTPAEFKILLTQRVENSLTEFYNRCHDEQTGKFCDDPARPGQRVRIEKATPAEKKSARTKALAKIRIAPTPTPEDVQKAREELARAKQGKGRAGGESRGGSAAARRKQAFNLFKEFGGVTRGYIVDHQSGIKLHYTNDPKLNPKGYPELERGKVFTKFQGGGYQLENLIPESFTTNRSRSKKTVRKENLT